MFGHCIIVYVYKSRHIFIWHQWMRHYINLYVYFECLHLWGNHWWLQLQHPFKIQIPFLFNKYTRFWLWYNKTTFWIQCIRRMHAFVQIYWKYIPIARICCGAQGTLHTAHTYLIRTKERWCIYFIYACCVLTTKSIDLPVKMDFPLGIDHIYIINCQSFPYIMQLLIILARI